MPDVSSVDLGSSGFGMNWSHTRSWTGLNNGSLNGNGWAVTSVPYIVVAGGDNGIGIVLAGTENDDRLSIVWGGIQSKAFTIPTTGPYTSFQPWGAQLTKLEQVTGVLRFTDEEGNVTEFYDVRRDGSNRPVAGSLAADLTGKYGKFKSFIAANGTTRIDAAYDTSGYLTSVTRFDSTNSSLRERFVYTYTGESPFPELSNDLVDAAQPPQPKPRLIARVQLQRSTNAGSTWSLVREAIYTYYTGRLPGPINDPNGRLGDLKLAQVKDPSGAVIDSKYYRYYKLTGEKIGISNGPTNNPATTAGPSALELSNQTTDPSSPSDYDAVVASGLKTVVEGASFDRLSGAVSGYDTAADSTIQPYVNHYFEYRRWGDHVGEDGHPDVGADTWDNNRNFDGKWRIGYRLGSRYHVVKEVAQGSGCSSCSGGMGTYKFEYAPNYYFDTTAQNYTGVGFQTLDRNYWRMKTTEFLPDSSSATFADNDRNVVYTNEVGQPMLEVFVDVDTAYQSVGSISRPLFGTTVRVAATGHGLVNGDVVAFSGIAPHFYNGVFTVTWHDADNFEFAIPANFMPTTAQPARDDPITDPAADGIKFAKVLGQWRTFYKYNDATGQLELKAYPSAIEGHDETKTDLLNSNAGNYTLLKDTDGLVEVTAYGDTTTATDLIAGDVAGYYKSTSVRRGETTGAIVVDSVKYKRNPTGSSPAVYVLAEQTEYRNAGDTTGPTTTYSYTWFGTTAQPLTMTVTYPAVSAGNNGSGTSDTEVTNYDRWGRTTLFIDGAGVAHDFEYDLMTGGLTYEAKDSFIAVQYVVDGLGRPLERQDTELNLTYFRYNDAAHETRVYPGWVQVGSNYDTTGPVQVLREDRPGSYVESLTFDMAPIAGTTPSGTEAISTTNLQTLSRDYTSAGGQLVYSDRYFSFSGMAYSTAVDIGTVGVNRYRSEYAYNERGRLERVKNEAGTIRITVSDGLGRAVSQWVGTDDTGATHTDPDGSGAPNNMLQVSASVYDGGGVGDGNLTRYTLYPGDGQSVDRVTDYYFDWRNRMMAVKGGVEGTESTSVNRPLRYFELDNLGRTTADLLYDGDGVTLTVTNGVPVAPSSTLLRAKTTTEYDERDRAFRTKQYSVDGSGNVPGNYLKSEQWFDARGNVIKSFSPTGPTTKLQYDGPGRLMNVFVTDASDDTGYGDADDVTGDRVVEQTEYAYDLADNVILTTLRRRFHTTMGTGGLGTNNTGNFARVSYVGTYYDAAYRVTASVDVGTNAGSAYTRPSGVPGRSATTLVTSYDYNPAGWMELVTDPKNIKTKRLYDNAGRLTRVTEAYDASVNGGEPSTSTPATNRRTDYAYGSLDRVLSVTAVLLPDGADAGTEPDSMQRTAYDYDPGATTYVKSYDFLSTITYPDKTTGLPGTSVNDKQRYTRNRLGEAAIIRDPNQTQEDWRYSDAVGRPTESRITLAQGGIDVTIRRRRTEYDGAGRPYLFTSYLSVGSVEANQVRRDYNGFGQLVTEYQEHATFVNTLTSPKVQYAYTEAPSDGFGGYLNHSRLTSITYPNGRVLNYKYTGASGLDDKISRVSSLEESGTAVPLEAYDYLGLGTIVQRRRPQPGSDLTYYGTGAIGDAGDQYAGLDRFDRIVDQWWKKGATDTDRFKYGYDENSNRTWKDVVGTGAPANVDEAYFYDNLNRLTRVNRGTLVSNTITDAAATWFQSWSLDALGNWNTFNDNGSSQTRTFNYRNQITSISGATTPTYDNNGNTTKDETNKKFLYDAWNRVVGLDANNDGDVLDVGDVTYAYDALDRRISEAPVGGTTVHLYYSANWQVLEEREGASTTAKRQNVWGLGYVDALVLRDRDTVAGGDLGKLASGLDERVYIQQDANYNVTSLVNTSGSVVERFRYAPYGSFIVLNGAADKDSGVSDWSIDTVNISDWGQVYLFEGGRYDTATGNYHFRKRDFDLSLGTWNRQDPLGYTNSLNMLLYVNGNPSLFSALTSGA